MEFIKKVQFWVVMTVFVLCGGSGIVAIVIGVFSEDTPGYDFGEVLLKKVGFIVIGVILVGIAYLLNRPATPKPLSRQPSME